MSLLLSCRYRAYSSPIRKGKEGDRTPKKQGVQSPSGIILSNQTYPFLQTTQPNNNQAKTEILPSLSLQPRGNPKEQHTFLLAKFGSSMQTDWLKFPTMQCSHHQKPSISSALSSHVPAQEENRGRRKKKKNGGNKKRFRKVGRNVSGSLTSGRPPSVVT